MRNPCDGESWGNSAATAGGPAGVPASSCDRPMYMANRESQTRRRPCPSLSPISSGMGKVDREIRREKIPPFKYRYPHPFIRPVKTKDFYPHPQRYHHRPRVNSDRFNPVGFTPYLLIGLSQQVIAAPNPYVFLILPYVGRPILAQYYIQGSGVGRLFVMKFTDSQQMAYLCLREESLFPRTLSSKNI